MRLLHGDCLEQMKTLPDNSVDAIVSDPPYGISFMAKKWDYDVPKVEVWKEAMRVLKPGGHALIACGTRTQHRMVCNIEDAGFEIRDVVSWIYGQGFPKSLNISKAIDKAAGAEREVGPVDPARAGRLVNQSGDYSTDAGWSAGNRKVTIDPPATEAAKQWDGWETALKPACEFFTLARKPLSEKTVAANVLKWGTGGINVDGCRVGDSKNIPASPAKANGSIFKMKDRHTMSNGFNPNIGRFPANLIHDGSQEVLDLFPETKSGKDCKRKKQHTTNCMSGTVGNLDREEVSYGDSGSASRFFYCAKASKKDRDEGNTHPTVKPTALMQYLCRLITPTGGTVLDPYMGSGSTGKAALKEGFDFIGCELDEDYYKIAQARITNEQNQ
jgi:DNA modification methylase